MRNRQFNIVVTLVLAFVVMACGASARQKTLTATYVATNVAAIKLVKFADERESKIVAEARNYELGKAELDEFRAKVDRVTDAIAAVYRTIAAAAVLNDKASLDNMVQAGLLMKGALAELGVK